MAAKDDYEQYLSSEMQSLLGNKPYRTPKEFSKKELDVDNKIFDLTFDTPRLGRSKTVIVSGVAFSANRDVVIIQEAKESARGLWYLPAGRLEINETLQAAVKREFQEEAGLLFEPRRLISVECRGCSWIRFNFLGEIVGGKMKDTADQESLCAKWGPLRDIVHQKMSLRSNDIIPLLLLANYMDTKARQPIRSPSPGLEMSRLPLTVGWQSCHLRLVLTCQHLPAVPAAEGEAAPPSSSGTGPLTAVLCRTARGVAAARLPVIRVPHPMWLDSVAHLLTNKVVGQPVSLNSVLHCEFASANSANVGVFLTLLCQLPSRQPLLQLPPQPLSPDFAWVPVTDPGLSRHLLAPDEFAAATAGGGGRDLAVKANPFSAHLCLIGGCVHANLGAPA